MKKLLSLLILFIPASFILAQTNPQSVGLSINNDATPAHPSAILDVKSTDKGLLIPRLTLDQRNAIPVPAKGLLVFQTTGYSAESENGFVYFDGNTWKPFSIQSGTNESLVLKDELFNNATNLSLDELTQKISLLQVYELSNANEQIEFIAFKPSDFNQLINQSQVNADPSTLIDMEAKAAIIGSIQYLNERMNSLESEINQLLTK